MTAPQPEPRPAVPGLDDVVEIRRSMPQASVERLPGYLRVLTELSSHGVTSASSQQLAELAGVGPAQLRKDLSHLGSHGRRGVGYDVDTLRERVQTALGLVVELPVAIVGAGNLGHALANYSGFGARGFTVVALLDASPALVGTEVAGVVVEDVARLAEVVRDLEVAIVVIATPGDQAQRVCDVVVGAGVREILNFAPRALHVPEGVELRSVDLGSELQILAFHSRERSGRPQV
ncbi:AT-rich DNA-binding protein [Sanguibacter keddieii DSM 10542]|uniref:Redox-sensing transcriptional repressor Rex n=1 Tax=Sanguibacter keddieii (strain ATCC 51767 / DSM 10542 / NCFB 3025 / ST-74) TaxID=446469 RepID=D1BBA6_SANKS|nr:redox-sensing transcriptional repressor Rex [Sanguibacter keddieii]ACZ20672.1 AT-rich DNA-binding protein [Sanguibacter keddieii DSM 10542]